MNPTERQQIPVITETDTVRTFVEVPSPVKQTAWTSQSCERGVYSTQAGVIVGGVSIHVRVAYWDAPAALAKLEAELIAAVADVRAHKEHGTMSIHGVK